MNSAEYVNNLINTLEIQGEDPQMIAWKAALACEGWPYVFGARGQYCTPANRRARYSDDHPTIKTKCRNFNGTGTCEGCQWFPGCQLTRFFDCRGFTYWILKQVYNWELMGAGCTSQWNTASNWQAKGTVADGIPANTLVCLFYPEKGKPQTMAHTGFYFNGETVECSSGVQHSTKLNSKWTHWAVPACIETIPSQNTTDQHDGFPDRTGWRPTIRRGSKGDIVTECQTMLVKLGYDIGPCGIDGDFGRATLAAVKAFQTDHKLVVDGVVGVMTWDALDKAVGALISRPAESVTTYKVIISGLDLAQAQAIAGQYPGNCEIVEGSGGQ